MKFILAITTFNRLNRLRKLIKSFQETRSAGHSWRLLVADDGSTDGTLNYLDELQSSEGIHVVRNNRNGIHHQFNTLLLELEKTDFDLCFKSDDDIEFIRAGWDNLYEDAISHTGYAHLCYYDLGWRPEKNLSTPVTFGPLVSYCMAKDVQGAFFTLTPDVLKKVGYMDTATFGYRGVGHIDYTMRACRMGFNDILHPFDVQHSNEYIRTQAENYKTALPSELIEGMEDPIETERKYKIIEEQRGYIPYGYVPPPINAEIENLFLKRAVQSLKQQRIWYEDELQHMRDWEKKQYGHLPAWYVRFGKIFKLLNR